MNIVRTLLIQGPPGPPGTVPGPVTSWTPGTVPAGGFVKTVVTVTGAVVGLPCLPPAYDHVLPDGLFTWAQVTAANTVAIYIFNSTAAPVAAPAGNIYVEVMSQ